MATTSISDGPTNAPIVTEEMKKLLWGDSIKPDVFLRWTQGFLFSEDEPSALVQVAGGPCAVIAPVQGFLLKNMIFSFDKTSGWNTIEEEQRNRYLVAALHDILAQTVTSSNQGCVLVGYDTDKGTDTQTDGQSSEDGESSPKKQRLSHDQFHKNISCLRCSTEELHHEIQMRLPMFMGPYGVMLYLYSVVLSKGVETICSEMLDPSESLIDGLHGHGTQSLINLMLTGRAVSNVWDNDKEVTGLTLHGIGSQATVGFLTLLEHLRYCEVGWYLKNPHYPVWLLGSETHLTVLFSCERSLVSVESPEAAARRIFNSFDTEGSGFVSAGLLGDLLQALELVSEPEYVKIMLDKMDPEQLGIVTLNGFMEEFFPSNGTQDAVQSFTLFHYNGLQSAAPSGKVKYQEASAVLMEVPELQLITDTSPIKTCLMTKWPTIELTWTNDHIPSMN